MTATLPAQDVQDVQPGPPATDARPAIPGPAASRPAGAVRRFAADAAGAAAVVTVAPLCFLQAPNAIAWAMASPGPGGNQVLRAAGLALPAMAVLGGVAALAVTRLRAWPVLLTGLLAMAAGDALGGAAHTVGLIGADRILHGAAAGVAMPAVLALAGSAAPGTCSSRCGPPSRSPASSRRRRSSTPAWPAVTGTRRSPQSLAHRRGADAGRPLRRPRGRAWPRCARQHGAAGHPDRRHARADPARGAGRARHRPQRAQRGRHLPPAGRAARRRVREHRDPLRGGRRGVGRQAGGRPALLPADRRGDRPGGRAGRRRGHQPACARARRRSRPARPGGILAAAGRDGRLRPGGRGRRPAPAAPPGHRGAGRPGGHRGEPDRRAGGGAVRVRSGAGRRQRAARRRPGRGDDGGPGRRIGRQRAFRGVAAAGGPDDRLPGGRIGAGADGDPAGRRAPGGQVCPHRGRWPVGTGRRRLGRDRHGGDNYRGRARRAGASARSRG